MSTVVSPSPASAPPAAIPAGWARRRGDGLQSLIWVVTAGLIVVPLLPLVYASFRSRPLYEPGGVFTLDGYRTLLSDHAFWSAVLSTVEFAATVTVISVAVGGGLAVLCERTDLPGRKAITWLAILPILLPPLGLIMGWSTLYGDGGYLTSFITGTLHLPWDLGTPWGMGVMGAAVSVPIALITTRAALRAADPALEDAARISGASTIRVLSRITVPMVRPAFLSAGVLIFTISLEQLGIPIFLGAQHNVNFIASYLYNTWSNSPTPDPASVSAGAVLLLAVASAMIVLRRRLIGDEQRFVSSPDADTRRRAPLPLRGWRAPLSLLVIAYLAVTIFAPVGGVVLASFVSLLTPLISPFKLLTLDNFHAVFSDPTLSSSIRNSLIVAGAGSVATTALIALATLVAHRSSFVLRRSLRFLMFYPRSVPGIIVSLAFFWSFLFFVPPGAWVRSNLIGEVIALAVRGIPLAYMIMYPSLVRIATELDDAARVAGAGWWTTSRRVVLPLLRPAMLGSLVILFVAILSDYEAAIFLAKPNTELMSVVMLQLYARGTQGPPAALAVLQLGITAIVLGAGALVFARSTRGGRRRA
ncbi:MAG TPA: iron ABC transporter permease [Solirubrobacteraceae bacterium]|nr:iron ABC transporter permease [Solirubrobacteraceae bacterium]